MFLLNRPRQKFHYLGTVFLFSGIRHIALVSLFALNVAQFALIVSPDSEEDTFGAKQARWIWHDGGSVTMQSMQIIPSVQ